MDVEMEGHQKKEFQKTTRTTTSSRFIFIIHFHIITTPSQFFTINIINKRIITSCRGRSISSR
uniref:Uncharacterized protein n=1 Tax=Meloidogyne enterolobii TaxID=390850 RepID=A0A6V7WMV5_MELEN|nr:unnamed protein product [Meloidogyne enterolobii]